MEQLRPVRLRNYIAYAFGEFYGGGSFIVISLLFIYFLTDVVGLSPSLAGLVVLIGKGWDAVSDPIMGYISDNMKTRFGRRRIFFLIGVVPVALTFLMLWIEFRFDNEFYTFLYYAFSYVLFSTVFTMVMIPYRALNAEMSPEYTVRTKLTGAKMIISQISSLLAGTLPKIIIDRLYAGNPGKGFLVMGVAFSLLYSLPWIVVFLGTWELKLPEGEEKTGISFWKGLSSLMVNRSFRIHMGLYIAAYSAMDLLMAMFIYYLTYYLDKSGIYSLCLGVMFITNMLMLPVYVFIANKKGKGFAYNIGLAVWFSAMALSTLLTPATPTWAMAAFSFMIGLGMSAGVLMPWAILPSLVDVDELITGKQRAGFCSGAMTLIRKLVQALTLFVFGVLLDLIGYVPKVTQTPDTLFWLKMLFFVAPGACIILGIFFGSKFRITPATHGVLKEELERLRSGGDRSAVSAEARNICELLTGLEYGKLFPRK
ncbi:MAG TPA: MFS transporter [Spirochaetes bacterium]|nr:MFS transporter [Spirochaetota bacterium]